MTNFITWLFAPTIELIVMIFDLPRKGVVKYREHIHSNTVVGTKLNPYVAVTFIFAIAMINAVCIILPYLVSDLPWINILGRTIFTVGFFYLIFGRYLKRFRGNTIIIPLTVPFIVACLLSMYTGNDIAWAYLIGILAVILISIYRLLFRIMKNE